MIAPMLAALAVALSPVQQADTTFSVRAGGVLAVHADGGSVVVGVWDRDAIRIISEPSGRSRPRVRVNGSQVTVRTESRQPGLSQARYRITVPRRYAVRIEGIHVDASVDGTHGDVAVVNIEGTIRIRNVTGGIDVESVSGDVLIQDTRGSVVVSTTNQGIRLERVTGRIQAETANGSVVLRGIESSEVRASTINGLVEYDGAVRDNGSYYLGTHNGQITMSLAENTNASVTIATHTGKVESAFPVSINALRDRRTHLTLGSGSAAVELQSFNGTVHLVRPRGR